MAQIYGYIVCLVAVITLIICLSVIIPAIIDLGDPLHSGSVFSPQGTPSLASFENYKMDMLKSSKKEGEQDAQGYVPDDNTLRSMYEAAKADKIQTARHQSMRSIIVSSIIMLVSSLLGGKPLRSALILIFLFIVSAFLHCMSLKHSHALHISFHHESPDEPSAHLYQVEF